MWITLLADTPTPAPIPVQPVGISLGTWFSVGASIITVVVGVISVLGVARRWANRYLGEMISRTLVAQGDIKKTVVDIAEGVKELANDVKLLSGQVEKLALRMDVADRRLEDHLRDAEARIREGETRAARMEQHMNDHFLHVLPSPPPRRR